jgi:putative transposase
MWNRLMSLRKMEGENSAFQGCPSRMSGLTRIRWSREILSQPSSCTVTKDSAGQYHVCSAHTEELEFLPRVNGEDDDLRFVSADLGIEGLAVLSTSEKKRN